MRRIALAILIVLAACRGDHHPVPKNIVIVPIGTVPADVLAHLRRELPPILERDVTVAAPIPIPEHAFDKARQQYLGSALLDELKRRDFADADRVVGVIDADAYAPGLNFIFGQADKPGRFAVVALPRFRWHDASRLPERAVKVTTHELGHTFGFAHCENRKCVMHFANSVAEADETEAKFCGNERLP